MKKDYENVKIGIDKKEKIVQLTIIKMTKEARKRLSDKILNDEPIEMVFFEIN